MTEQAIAAPSPPPDPWLIARRIEAWAGEFRVNLIRLLGILLFYGRHLIEVMLAPADSPVRGIYHLRITVVVLVWSASAAIVHILLSRRFYPPAMRFLTSLTDVLMITIICAIAGGPRTPLVLLYFLVIATTPLRLCLELVYTTTAAAMLGYLFVLGYYAWYLIGFHEYYASPELRIPRSQEAIVLLALLTAGLLAGQCIRQSRRLAQRYPVTLVESAPHQSV